MTAPDSRPTHVDRIGWPDVAKGLCIVLVVMWHVVVKHTATLPWHNAHGIPELWVTLNAQLLPLRMPLFFLISGLFAHRVIAHTTGRPVAERAARLALLYLVWVLIQTAALGVAAPEFDTARAHSMSELLLQLTISPTNLWYLLALALYLGIARLTRHVPTTPLLVGAALLSMTAALDLLPATGNLWQLGQNLFFFLAGLRLRTSVLSFAAHTSPLRVTGSIVVALAASITVGWFGLRDIFGVSTLLAIVMVATGIHVSRVIDHYPSMARPLRWIGKQTLPIYVIHMPVLAAIDHALRLIDPRIWHGALFAISEPLIVTALVIAGSLAIHRVLLRCGASILFDPLLVTSRAGRRHAAAPAGGESDGHLP